MSATARPLSDRAIVRLGAEDADACRRLSALAGWSHTLDDWRVRLGIGRALGVREGGGTLSAVGVSFPAAPGVGFIGLLLTDPERRGEGLGTAVTSALAADLRAEARLPCLFAVPAAIPLYERLGFSPEERLHQFRGTLPHLDTARLEGVRPITIADLAALLSLDRLAYGGDRAALIVDQIARNPALAFVMEAGGAFRGFGLGAARPGLTLLGPVVAREEATAVALLGALVKAAGPGPARCDTLSREDAGPAFAAALVQFGLRPESSCSLMVLGRKAGPVFSAPDMLFAAQSAASG